MFKEKTKVGDAVEVGIAQKSPEQLEAIANGDYDELKRRRAQMPDKWYPIPEPTVITNDSDHWPLLAGHWLKVVYSNGDVLMGKVIPWWAAQNNQSQRAGKFLLLGHGALFNDGLSDIDHVPTIQPIVQLFCDDIVVQLCERCIFWKERDLAPGMNCGMVSIGECQLGLPLIVSRNVNSIESFERNNVALWPHVYRSDSCKGWQQRE